jgi:hypothetical protein
MVLRSTPSTACVSKESFLSYLLVGFFYRLPTGNRREKTGPVNRTNRSVYRDHWFCYVGFMVYRMVFYYRTAAVTTV